MASASNTKKLTIAPKGRVVLAYDLGGTKIEAGLVRDDGRVLAFERVPVRTDAGPSGLVRQMGELARGLLSRPEGRKVKAVGLASAGPLLPAAGILLDPTNIFTGGRSWGKVPIARLLSQRLRMPVTLENDAAAAVLAEKWRGAARTVDNAVMLTLGTGLGVGVICDGNLVRSGRGMHPEGGHILLRYGDKSAACACGTLGCAEAFLAGHSFGRRAVQVHGVKAQGASEVAELARRGDAAALKAFDEYADLLAAAVQCFAVLYAPERVILGGSFAQASDLYLQKSLPIIERLLERRRIGVDLVPKMVVSHLSNHSGLLGGAFVALQHPSKR
ncbi:MAG TPA: ROK family protein [Bdellovibrionota bacterium]|nr:ROK family protein [Bdellovibrionota bacterium]